MRKPFGDLWKAGWHAGTSAQVLKKTIKPMLQGQNCSLVRAHSAKQECT